MSFVNYGLSKRELNEYIANYRYIVNYYKIRNYKIIVSYFMH